MVTRILAARMATSSPLYGTYNYTCNEMISIRILFARAYRTFQKLTQIIANTNFRISLSLMTMYLNHIMMRVMIQNILLQAIELLVTFHDYKI